MQYIVIAIVVVFLVSFVVKAASLFKKARKIDESGIVTEGTVSRIEIESDSDSGSSEKIYIQYVDGNGESRESLLSVGSGVGFKQGDKVMIKYLPGEYDIVRLAEKTFFV